MGRQHRMTKRVLCAAIAAGFALCGCSDGAEDQKAQMRRDVLRANNLVAERRKQLEAVRLTDENGDLIPSTQKVAGIVLPRGYTPKFKMDHESYFDGELPYSKLTKYFTEHLDFMYVERPNNSTLRFVKVRSKGDSEMDPVTITISPVPGMLHWSRIRVLIPQPLPERLQTKAEIDAELLRRRQREMH